MVIIKQSLIFLIKMDQIVLIVWGKQDRHVTIWIKIIWHISWKRKLKMTVLKYENVKLLNVTFM